VLPFSASGILALGRDLRLPSGERRRGLVHLATFALLFLVTNPRVVSAIGIPVRVERDAPFHRFNLAVIHEQEGDFERAIEEYRVAAESGVNDPRIFLNLGNSLMKTGRYDEAREEYLKTLRIAPDFESAVRNNLGILAAHQGDWPVAIREFEASLAANPENTGALSNLASAYLSSGRFDDAVVAFRRALLRPDANEAQLRRSLGMAYYESGLLEEAEVELSEALKLDPRDLIALLTIAKVCAETGRDRDAEQWWATARQFGGGSPAVEEAIREYQEGRARRMD
jgi:Flp pilus assembly protein TadD